MDTARQWYRISEVEELTGVPRRTIHFYLQQGLLHSPRKTGKTMAYYDDTHLEALRAIKKAKDEGLPLFAIRERLAATMPEAARRDPSRPADSQGAWRTTGRRKRKKSGSSNQTRDDILAVGRRLFRAKGYKNTRINDITRELNVGKGTFYFYFSDKKELFLECVPMIFTELFSRGWEEIAREKDPLKRLQMRARLTLPVLNEFVAILSLCREAMDDPDPNLKNLGRQVFASIRKPLEVEIKKGMADGSFRKVNPRVFATMMIGVMEGLEYLVTYDRDFHAEKIQQDVAELFSLALTGNA
ncbi:MAG: MerR family transcriptional regulator [Desulfatibacillaceae bacterium]